MPELKPCPFCGGQAQIRYLGYDCGPDGYMSNIYMGSKLGFVLCSKCGASTRKMARVSGATEKWNRRFNKEDI